MHTPVSYNVQRKGTTISLIKGNKETLANIVVDVTDNRLTIQSINEETPLDAIKTLTEYLDTNFGAKQVFVLPEKLHAIFSRFGFIKVDSTNKEDRLQTASFKDFFGIPAEPFPELSFVDGERVKTVSEENIRTLAQGSGFLKTKIEQYEAQGYPGFQLMCESSRPFGVINQTRELVAFCRVTELNKGNYYLSDTFVDEKAFDGKQKGTAFLYQQIGKAYQEEVGDGSVFLIVPSDRMDEFQKHYGCTAPENVMFKFCSPGPELEKVFSEELERMKNKPQMQIRSGA
jgi:hypothetical protein